jgi:hypothetical protein
VSSAEPDLHPRQHPDWANDWSHHVNAHFPWKFKFTRSVPLPAVRSDHDNPHKEPQGSASQRCATYTFSLPLPHLKFNETAAQTVMCAPQLTAMLSCWAATSDVMSVDACKTTANDLFQCMRTTVRELIRLWMQLI